MKTNMGKLKKSSEKFRNIQKRSEVLEFKYLNLEGNEYIT
jgi:hypothetical protein